MSVGSKLQLIAIGYAKRALKAGTREHARMRSYARVMGEYHLIVFTRRSEGYADYVQYENLHLYATNARTRLGMLWRAVRIGRRILEEQGGTGWVVSSQDPFEASVVGSAVARGNRATHHIQIHGDVFNPKNYKTSLLNRARCLRVVSTRIKRSLELLGVAAEKITVLPIFSDLSSFSAVGTNRNYAVGARISFLYVGRFAPEKNPKLIIDSFAALAKKYPETTLTLMGAGPLEHDIQQCIAQHGLQGRVNVLPWTEVVAAVMATHDVFCLASHHEGWGMVLVEAAAAGMPIVTTEVGCAGECVRDGETGRVVLSSDVEHYAAAMEVYLKNPSLVAAEGVRGHTLVTGLLPDETLYTAQLVESYSSCVRR